MSNQKIFSAAKIFTGEKWLTDQAVVVSGNVIQDIVSVKELSAAAVKQFDNCLMVPAFMDIQIYGAYGKLLAVYPEADSLKALHRYCLSGGAPYCLPTVATNTYEVFKKSIDAVKAYWQEGGKGIMGIHLEGPWINTIKRGAHIESLIHSPSLQQVNDMLDYGEGVIKMITLAPEQCSDEVIDLILSRNIIISAGHSNASYEQAKHSFNKGVQAVTHLYNAMSSLQHRSPGLVGAAMDDDKVMASIIPDGYHVDYAAIRIAKSAMGERLFVITDAVTETDKGAYQHHQAGDKYEAAGVLSGSALTMIKAVKNLVQHAGIELGEAIRMCSLYPANLMGWQNRVGKIEKGFPANFILMNEALELIDVISESAIHE